MLTEMSYLNGKSPISYLFEQCMKRALTPNFEVEDDIGPVHQKVFVIKVTAGEFVGRGSGSSKQKAKHLAALEALNQMMGISSEDGSLHNVSDDVPNKMQNNPISALQEITQKRMLPPPIYNFEMALMQPVVREFTCTVNLLKLAETGVGKTKKAAKRAAAKALLDRLEVDDLSSQLDEALKSFTDDISISQNDIRSAYQALKEGRKPSNMTTPYGKSFSSVNASRRSPNYCDFLQELADDQKFEVTYVDVPEPSCTGLNQCIVQLSTLPVVVCHGMGSSMDESHNQAAEHALFYLGTLSMAPSE